VAFLRQSPSQFFCKINLRFEYNTRSNITVQKIMGRLCVVVEPRGFCKKVCNSLNMIVNKTIKARDTYESSQTAIKPFSSKDSQLSNRIASFNKYLIELFTSPTSECHSSKKECQKLATRRSCYEPLPLRNN
jgi:hypothetical protein